MTTWIALVLVVLFATGAFAYGAAVRSAALQRRFEALGTLPGRRVEEIIKHAGAPSRRTRLGRNREMLEWRRINYYIGLSFTDDICTHVADERGN
ncbi:MAG TPA: hypothetical protein VLJ58_17270 [Ramlibacter sp.]|nr:hypothetical protein [Ramlibacter sp.]